MEDGRVPLLPFRPPSKGLGVMVCTWPSMASRASVLCGCSLRLGKNGGHHCVLYKVKVNVDCQHLLRDRPLGMSVGHIHTGLTEEENPPYMWVASFKDLCSQPNKEEKAAARQRSRLLRAAPAEDSSLVLSTQLFMTSAPGYAMVSPRHLHAACTQCPPPCHPQTHMHAWN